jgi:hypothetical protein
LYEDLGDHFDEGLELMTDVNWLAVANYEEDGIAAIQKQAISLHGLIHARWIHQHDWLAVMQDNSGIVVEIILEVDICFRSAKVEFRQSIRPRMV